MFNPQIAIGQVLTEEEVNKTFHCQPFKGIRMGMNNKVIVIVSGSPKKEIYADKWVGDTLLYNGMDVSSDANGNQTLETAGANNNRKLYDTYDNPDSADVFLFVKKEKNKCVYKGRVRLSQKPYQDVRHDDATRKVWIFPLQLVNVDLQTQLNCFQEAENAAAKEKLNVLYEKVKGKHGDDQPEGTRKVFTTQTNVYERNPQRAAYIKMRANGVCDLCGKKAPFFDKDGLPYLEAHHIVWLSKGGTDEIDNEVALCPNCHKKMHIVDDPNDVNALKQKVNIYKINNL